MDESIKIKLKKEVDLSPLIALMEASGVDFKNRKLNGPFGMATYLSVYLDVDKLLDCFNTRMIWFIILHEMGHFRRIQKMGKDKPISMFSLEDYDAFCNHIISEEIFADRYACFIYYLNNKQEFPRLATQQLYLVENQQRYKMAIQPLFGVVKNKEENYIQLFESYIIQD